jgi:hypothetical protein
VVGAVPSLTNLVSYLSKVLPETMMRGVDVYWMGASDESWRTAASATLEASSGLMTGDRRSFKAGVKEALTKIITCEYSECGELALAFRGVCALGVWKTSSHQGTSGIVLEDSTL